MNLNWNFPTKEKWSKTVYVSVVNVYRDITAKPGSSLGNLSARVNCNIKLVKTAGESNPCYFARLRGTLGKLFRLTSPNIPKLEKKVKIPQILLQ